MEVLIYPIEYARGKDRLPWTVVTRPGAFRGDAEMRYFVYGRGRVQPLGCVFLGWSEALNPLSTETVLDLVKLRGG